jgi:hypothetical protein
MKKLYTLLCLILVASSVFSQRIEKFTREDEAFIKELAKVFDDSRKGEGKEFIEKQFMPVWLEDGAYTLPQQEMIFETLDMMLKNKNKVYPEFEQYIKALIFFPKAAKTDKDFLEWQTVLAKLIADKKLKKYLPEFLEASSGMFENKTFYKTETIAWVSSSNGYQFVFDSVPCIVFPALTLKCYSKGDSSVIQNTNGIYFPTTDRFVGDKGKVTWQRAGFDPTKTYAEFNAFNIRLKGSTFTVDSVMFYNEFLIDHFKED